MSVSEPCACVRCRVYAAVQDNKPGDPPRTLTGAEVNAALDALGDVAAEFLAHAPTKVAKIWTAEVLETRKRWMKDPRIMVQQQAKGTA